MIRKSMRLMVALAAMCMMFCLSACGSSNGVTETKQVDSLEELTISQLDELDQHLDDAFEDIYGVMTNDAGWVTGGNDILAQLDEMEKGIVEALNGGENFDVSGVWTSDRGFTLTVTQKENDSYDWEITGVEGDTRKTWRFSGAWNMEMGGVSYEGCAYYEAPAAEEASEAAPVSADGKGTVTYLNGELIWKVMVDGQEQGEPVTFHR
jgi:hypothetical protein